jgi:hypothetical protein
MEDDEVVYEDGIELNNDIYDSGDELVEDDEISHEECCFMAGYNEGGLI